MPEQYNRKYVESWDEVQKAVQALQPNTSFFIKAPDSSPNTLRLLRSSIFSNLSLRGLLFKTKIDKDKAGVWIYPNLTR